MPTIITNIYHEIIQEKYFLLDTQTKYNTLIKKMKNAYKL